MHADSSVTPSGTPIFSNPILDADWPDPDAIRVGEDYYLIASSFNRSPGLPVLHSKDLVNWTLINHALAHNTPQDYYSEPRHGCGVWAPSLRYHEGLFYIAYPDPDQGIFITTATDPAGQWSTPKLVLAGSGLIDPCPLWDEDGRTYLVFGWANSRTGQKNLLSVAELSADLSTQVGPMRTVIDGDLIPPCTTLEGPKFYKHLGYYWIFAPAGGVATGWQYAFRSKDPYGPYESRIVLTQGDSDVNGPHQGAWVDTPSGEHWFFHFQDRGAFGRVVHLQPMIWADDDWPVIGIPLATDPTCGQPAPRFTFPLPPSPSPQRSGSPAQLQREPVRSDDWSNGVGLQWHFQANRPAETARTESGRVLVPLSTNDFGNLRTCGDFLGQQLPGYAVEVHTSVDLPELENFRTGLGVMGEHYAWVGVNTVDGVSHLVARSRTTPSPREQELDLVTPVPLPPGTRSVDLRCVSDDTGQIDFYWRLGPSQPWHGTTSSFQAVKGRWIGAEVGIFGTGFTDPRAGSHCVSFGPVTFHDARTLEFL